MEYLIEPERTAEFSSAKQYITGTSWQRSAGDFWQREELPIKHMILPLVAGALIVVSWPKPEHGLGSPARFAILP